MGSIQFELKYFYSILDINIFDRFYLFINTNGIFKVLLKNVLIEFKNAIIPEGMKDFNIEIENNPIFSIIHTLRLLFKPSNLVMLHINHEKNIVEISCFDNISSFKSQFNFKPRSLYNIVPKLENFIDSKCDYPIDIILREMIKGHEGEISICVLDSCIRFSKKELSNRFNEITFENSSIFEFHKEKDANFVPFLSISQQDSLCKVLGMGKFNIGFNSTHNVVILSQDEIAIAVIGD